MLGCKSSGTEKVALMLLGHLLDGRSSLATSATTRKVLRLCTASAPDAITLPSGIEAPACTCGEQRPTRRHLAFDCRDLAPVARAQPIEEQYSAKLVDMPAPAVPWQLPSLDEELLQALRSCDGPAHAATDGGCLTAPGAGPWQVASWAVVVQLPNGHITLSGLVPA